jgi:hypothetical protein
MSTFDSLQAAVEFHEVLSRLDGEDVTVTATVLRMGQPLEVEVTPCSILLPCFPAWAYPVSKPVRDYEPTPKGIVAAERRLDQIAGLRSAATPLEKFHAARKLYPVKLSLDDCCRDGRYSRRDSGAFIDSPTEENRFRCVVGNYCCVDIGTGIPEGDEEFLGSFEDVEEAFEAFAEHYRECHRFAAKDAPGSFTNPYSRGPFY